MIHVCLHLFKICCMFDVHTAPNKWKVIRYEAHFVTHPMPYPNKQTKYANSCWSYFKHYFVRNRQILTIGRQTTNFRNIPLIDNLRTKCLWHLECWDITICYEWMLLQISYRHFWVTHLQRLSDVWVKCNNIHPQPPKQPNGDDV